MESGPDVTVLLNMSLIIMLLVFGSREETSIGWPVSRIRVAGPWVKVTEEPTTDTGLVMKRFLISATVEVKVQDERPFESVALHDP